VLAQAAAQRAQAASLRATLGVALQNAQEVNKIAQIETAPTRVGSASESATTVDDSTAIATTDDGTIAIATTVIATIAGGKIAIATTVIATIPGGGKIAIARALTCGAC
jgi:hypothetical protein